MKNSFCRVMCLLLTALLLAALCGCGEDDISAVIQEQEQMGTPDIFIEDGDDLGRDPLPPALVLETTDGVTASAVNATLGGYVWEWVDENGKVKLDEEEAPCAADMKEIAVVERSTADGGVKLLINGGSLRSVQMWVDGAPMEEGERLTIEGNRITFPESGAYRYEVVVEYPGGRVYYAFMVSK